MVDHRDVILQAVKERYSDYDFLSVSAVPVSTGTCISSGLHIVKCLQIFILCGIADNTSDEMFGMSSNSTLIYCLMCLYLQVVLIFGKQRRIVTFKS